MIKLGYTQMSESINSSTELTNLTNYERTVLKEITEDDFYEDGLDSVIWADVFEDNCSLDNKSLRGVLSSLVKKGIINNVAKGRNGIISFTPYGKEVMMQLGYAKR